MNFKISSSFRKLTKNDAGFTLVELMIALVITGIIIASMYMAYLSQQKTYLVQEQVAEMQQNLRAGMAILAYDLRMAGYDGGNGTRHASCSLGAGGAATQPGVLAATATQLDFSMDLNQDGDCADAGENLTYTLYTTNAGVQALGRRDNSGGAAIQAVAEPFDGVEFLYKDMTGSPTTILADIRSVQISLLARASKIDRKYLVTKYYCPASNPLNPATGQCTQTNPASATIWGPYSDGYRRRLLIAEINCRNMGL